MKVALHLHTCRYSLCASDEPEAMLDACVRRGFDAVFLTEHDQVWPARPLDELRGQFPQLRILPGIERSIEDHHLLILGSNDAEYLRMRHFGAIFGRARRLGHLTVLAHPYRWFGGSDVLEERDLPDAIEHWTGNQQGEPAVRAAAAAGKLGLPLVFADDAHSTGTVGRFWVETHRPFETAGQLREIILGGAYDNRRSDGG